MKQIKSIEELNQLKPTIESVCVSNLNKELIIKTDKGFFIVCVIEYGYKNGDEEIGLDDDFQDLYSPREAVKLGLINKDELSEWLDNIGKEREQEAEYIKLRELRTLAILKTKHEP